MNKTVYVLLLFVLTACPFSGIYGQQNVSEKMTEKVKKDRERRIVLPKSDSHYTVTRFYVEEEPDADYVHASEKAYEAFRDIKYSIRIHWGVYSMLGIEASWPYLHMSPEKKMEYQNLYKTFNPTEFDAQEWMDLFKRSGIQAFAFTSKHHDGFSMFHTQTRVKQRVNFLDPEHTIEPCDLAYSIEETPFKRDIVKELCDAAHKNGIKIDLYFSHPDWFDADFRPYNYHPLTTPSLEANPTDYGADMKYDPKKIMSPNRTPEETARLVARHRGQIRELLTNYGKIDMICFDQWMGRDIWPEMRKTVKMMRKLQPDVMIRARGIGNYGDYFQPEGFVPGNKENSNMPWMSICLLGKIFAFDPNGENYKGAPWVIHNLIDCVAKGGSFMVCVSPDQTGKFHPTAVKQLEETGKWLKVNGEGIYGTTARTVWKDNDIYFTQAKNHSHVYALTEKWPGAEMIIPSVTPKSKSKLYLLGYKEPLQWSQTDAGIKVIIPEFLQAPENRPCEHAWVFKMEVKATKQYAATVPCESPKVIAHRGYWDVDGSAQNSITSLRKAQDLGIYGSEFDVWITSDGQLVVNHDATIGGFTIENSTYNQLKDLTLSNGEKIATLDQYLEQGKLDTKTQLILEIKTHSNTTNNNRVVAAVVAMVAAKNRTAQVEYVSFGLDVCKELIRLQPGAKVAYLNGDKTPAELHALNITGIDYTTSVLKNNPLWIHDAHQLGMTVNVWTVNNDAEMLEMKNAGVDYITTDKPVAAKTLFPVLQ